MEAGQLYNSIIHIGLPKCGSTMLQKNFFSRIDTHLFIHVENFESISRKSNVIVSNERISGKVWSINDRMKFSSFNQDWFHEYCHNIDEINRKFINSTIVLVIRPHADLVISLYKQYVHEGGAMSFSEFRLSTVVSEISKDFYRKRLDYLLENSTNEVIIISFDFLRSDFNKTLKNLAEKLDLKIESIGNARSNISLKNGQLELLRRWNRLNFFMIVPPALSRLLFKYKLTLRHVLQRFFNNDSVNRFLTTIFKVQSYRFETDDFLKADWLYANSKISK